jgi:type IV secretion system protein VirB6
MAGACPIPAPDDPMVRGLLTLVDCNVQTLAHQGYVAVFNPSGAFAGLLTALLTLYIGLLGYGLLLGRTRMQVGDLALTAVKLGAVVVLATQWDVYQTLVYDLLFRGPQQVADMILASPDGVAPVKGVFDRLQQDLDALNAFAEAYSKHSPIQTSPLMGGTAFGAFALTSSATILLLTSLGMLLAAKIILGLLLALGPLFIAMLLFEQTRGLFLGWLRAAIAVALAPLSATVILGVSLTMLEPQLVQLSDLVAHGVFSLAPVNAIFTLVLVLAAVSVGAVVVGAVIAGALNLPRPKTALRSDRDAAPVVIPAPVFSQTRAMRIVSSMTRRDSAVDRRSASLASTLITSTEDRRVASLARSDRGAAQGSSDGRLGQGLRRTVRPRTTRASAGRTR